MNQGQFNDRISWLSACLASQRNTLSTILLRLKGIAMRAGASLALHRKFMRLLEQIALDQEKERDLINEIEEMEKHHHNLKKRNLLRCVDEKPKPTPSLLKEETVKEEEKPKRASILTLLGILYLFSRKPIKHKNQDLTAD